MYTVHCTVYNVQCTLYNIYYKEGFDIDHMVALHMAYIPYL